MYGKDVGIHRYHEWLDLVMGILSVGDSQTWKFHVPSWNPIGSVLVYTIWFGPCKKWKVELFVSPKYDHYIHTIRQCLLHENTT